MKEYLIILDTSNKMKYPGFFFRKEQTFLLLNSKQSLSRHTNRGNLNKEHLAIPCLQQKTCNKRLENNPNSVKYDIDL